MKKLENMDKIFNILNSSGIVEFEWERDGKKIVIKRPEKVTCARKEIAPVEAKTQTQTEEEQNHFIKASLVGTCYLVSPQDKKTMVKVGDRIKSGDKLCFVEAMKVFKEIVSDKDGNLKEILVENGQSVMYGQPLFKITI